MAKHKKRSKDLDILTDLEGTIDGIVNSIESMFDRIVTWIKKHKKLTVLSIAAVLAWNYLVKEESYEDEDE